MWAQNEQKNTQNKFIEGKIRIDIIVETDKQYQEMVEVSDNIIFQLKQRDYWLSSVIIICQLIKWHDEFYTTTLEDVVCVSSYPMLESMCFDPGFLMEF